MDFIQTPCFISVLSIILQFFLRQTVCKQNYLFTFFNLQSATEIGDCDDQLSFFRTTCSFWRKQNSPLLCWEGLGAGGEGGNRGWDGWTASLTQWTWVWVNSGSLWWTERPGMLRFMGSQRVGHDWATELKWMYNILLGNYYSRQVLKNDLRASRTAYIPMEISEIRTWKIFLN